MKFLVALCLVAIASAITPPAAEDGIPMKLENVKLTPKEQQLKDALDIKWTYGFMAGPPFYSPHNGTFEGVKRAAFSSVNLMISPGQSGHEGDANWAKNDVSDLVFIYHSGAPAKVHLISEDGVYSTKVMGNPLDLEEAEFLVHVPKTVYREFESLSNTEATFHSYIDVPAWSSDDHQKFSPAMMAALFPQYSGLFEHLAKPGYQGEWTQ